MQGTDPHGPTPWGSMGSVWMVCFWIPCLPGKYNCPLCISHPPCTRGKAMIFRWRSTARWRRKGRCACLRIVLPPAPGSCRFKRAKMFLRFTGQRKRPVLLYMKQSWKSLPPMTRSGRTTGPLPLSGWMVLLLLRWWKGSREKGGNWPKSWRPADWNISCLLPILFRTNWRNWSNMMPSFWPMWDMTTWERKKPQCWIIM